MCLSCVVGLFLFSICVLKVPHWHIGWNIRRAYFQDYWKFLSEEDSCLIIIQWLVPHAWLALQMGLLVASRLPPLPQPSSLAASQFLKVSVPKAQTDHFSSARVRMSYAQKDVLFQRLPFKRGAIGHVLELREPWGGRKGRRPASYSVRVARGIFPKVFCVMILGATCALVYTRVCEHTHTHTHTHGSKMVPSSSKFWEHWVKMLPLRALNSKKGP